MTKPSMTETVPKTASSKNPCSKSETPPLRKHLLRLIRQLSRGDCAVGTAEDGQLRLTGAEERLYPEAAITEACSRGLARRHGRSIAASSEAATFLRRALVEGEEAFVEQHGEVVATAEMIEGTRQPVRRNLAESPLGAIARLKDRDGHAFLPAEALEAGERLLSDFTRGQLQPRITASWEPRLSKRSKGSAGGQADLADSAMAARDRFADAMEAMGPELSGVAADICCFSKGLETVERERQWPARSAKLMLRTALMALARHYAPPPARGKRSHHWGAEGYRPEI
ncbi:DUF6456 domain-containing protein [Rhizobium populisoli]|uniref:DUF6456 domain-containing protein n=1 Tax=Rhizobium populisoli TaxID=2859785 RepID=UPI001FE29BEF|nr:DUF6456 domain-containing protein [Rhizobium populisoli]